METKIKIERKPAVLKRCGFSNSTLYELISAGEFPRPVRIGARAVGWVSAEVDAWLAARIAERDQEARHDS